MSVYNKDELAYYIEKFLRQFEISECEISNMIEVVMQTMQNEISLL